MKSLGNMIKQLAGLVGTTDLGPWEDQFLADIASKTDDGTRTQSLSSKQVEKVEQMYRRHFGDS